MLVFTTLPAEVDARAFVQPLLEARLIACGTVLAPASSVYRWDGAVVESAEQQVLLKTTTGTLERLRDAALAHHPYDVPEWLIVPVAGGLPTYLAWVRGETAVP
ncbi:MAG: divalent-cation tolerance protein CutA [Gemmatimonas sp.]|uniref:divalent-cation tolerance protein CutA n=1 Tax=Gemmatimonas sp. TaxID=1962908 RepID=UPI00391F2B1A|nr:divalent-cation tolerance protein CutA [Gemmatimonadota bacterium]